MRILGIGILLRYNASLRASPPIWVSEASLARTRERASERRSLLAGYYITPTRVI